MEIQRKESALPRKRYDWFLNLLQSGLAIPKKAQNAFKISATVVASHRNGSLASHQNGDFTATPH
jgi:hypothetical protein